MSEGRDPATRVERAYKPGNPLFVMLLAATAKAMGLHVFRTDAARSAPIHVAANSIDALDRFDAKLNELYRQLDAEVTDFAIDFIARNLGVDAAALTKREG